MATVSSRKICLTLISSITLSAVNCLQNACPPPNAIVYEQAVSINTDITSNTTFFPIPQAPITITNAPTSYNGITTVRWTVEPSQSSSTVGTKSSSSAAPTSTSESFFLTAPNLGPGLKRQAFNYDYVTANGSTTDDCTKAIQYSIVNGMLAANVNGQLYYYSTTPNTAYQQFLPSAPAGSINTTFSIITNQDKKVLQWANTAFYNSLATFCATSDGTIYAVFQYNTQPSGCFFFTHSPYILRRHVNKIPSTIVGPTGLLPYSILLLP
ncbi:hypothetical protein MRB53_038764 [Persea americana]|nr:hypothetical protein MRB53_038764 [Persea americana]